MIRKAFLIFFMLLVIYQLVVSYYLKNFHLHTHQQQQNIIEAQEYIYSFSSSSVILGSSMSKRLNMEILHGIDNIAMNGGGVLTGLHIIELSSNIPDTLYMEVSNVLFRPLDKAMIEGLEQPLLFFLRKHFSMFREKNQPGIFLVWKSLRPLNYLFFTPAAQVLPTVHSTEVPKNDSVNFNVRAELAIKHKKEYDNLKDTAEWKNTLVEIRNTLKELEKRGVVIVLFEIPNDISIFESPRARFIRDWVKRNLFQYPFKELTPSQVASYVTTDGAHLDGESATRFSTYFNSHFRNSVKECAY